MGQLREILKQLILLLSLFGSQGTSYFGWQCLEGRLCFDSQGHTWTSPSQPQIKQIAPANGA